MTEGPTRLRDLLASAGRKLGMEAPEESALLLARWKDIVGPDVARHARPGRLRSGTLKVWVDSPSWATELSYLGPQIVRRAAEVIGPGAVSEIRPYLGRPPIPISSDSHGQPSGDRPARVGPDGKAHKSEPPEDPEEALARARLAWEKNGSRGRSSTSSDRQIPR